MILMLIALLVLPILALSVWLVYRLWKRARQKQAFRGAAVWLTGGVLSATFVLIGFMWGFLHDLGASLGSRLYGNNPLVLAPKDK